MARAGRDLEQLVAQLERALVGSSFTVKSPAKRVGSRSQQMREIDVLISGTVGSSAIAIAIECRNRSRPATVQWVEEAYAKGQDIGASRVVLVATAGFSKAASIYAVSLGCETRTIVDLSESEIAGWLSGGVLLVQRMVEFESVGISLRKESASTSQTIERSVEGALTPIFRDSSDGGLLSLHDVWCRLDLEQIYDGVDENRSSVEVSIRVADGCLEMLVADSWRHVDTLNLNAQVYVLETNPPLSRFLYEKHDSTTVDAYRFTICDEAGSRTVLLVGSSSSEGMVSVNIAVESARDPTTTRREIVHFGD